MKLAERCLLISVSFGYPGKNKQDKETTNEILKQKNASADSGTFTKHLYPDGAIKPVKKQEGVIGKLVDAYTYDWLRGQKLLPIAALLELREPLDKEVAAWNAMADASAANFDITGGWLEQAEKSRNGLFKREDYPATREAFRREFECEVTILPAPDEEHIYSQMAEDEIRIVKESTARQVAAVKQQAYDELVDRMASPLRNLIKQIANYDAKKDSGDRTRLCDSLVGNIADIAKLVPSLNIMDDPALASIGQELAEIGKHNPEILKVNKSARQRAAEQAANVLAKLEGSAK